tara:strand:- start:25892 stop:28171 length:2280 start_codon:yes stop_codon:yes gene_type:complete
VLKQVINFKFLIFSIVISSQSYEWTGNGDDVDFFNESNWNETTSGDQPQIGSMEPNQSIDFNLYISCDVYANNGQVNDLVSLSPEIFDIGPNNTWPYVFRASVTGDGNFGNQQTLVLNITSLPDAGANYRINRTVANGNWWFGEYRTLRLGVNVISAEAVDFDRSVIFQFSSGEISFESILFNGDVIYHPPNNSIILGSDNFIEISDGSLNGSSVNGGTLMINEGGYVNLTDSNLALEDTQVFFNHPLTWLRLKNINPNYVNSHYLNQFFIGDSSSLYPSNIRLDNYYENGTVIRPHDLNNSPLTIYSEENLGGTEAQITLDNVYSGSFIPNGMNNMTSSFNLAKGHMLTVAVNPDGSGVSQVFIASEENMEIHSLPNSLQSNISFIRVIPWNWVSKKGTAGDILGMNNTWFYRWSNVGESDLEREYSPMSWGYGGANDDNDILIYKSKYKSTHILAFNEPDDCNGQSGQFNNMCDEATALAVYKNLLKTGLRIVSPACRQGAVFSWLDNFNQLAIQDQIRIDVIAVHWYDWNADPQNSPNADPENIFNRFKLYLNQVHDLYGLPIWITEFNGNKYRSEEVNRAFMELALPYLETLDFVERYAWFEPNPVDHSDSGNGEFFDTEMNLTEIGQFYKNNLSNPSISYYSFPNSIGGSYVGNNNLNNEELINQFDNFCNTENQLSIGTIFNQSNNILKLYPNPSSKFIKVEFPYDVTSIKIFNLTGMTFRAVMIDNNIDISSLPSGLYFLRINEYYAKFIKN